MKNYQLVDYTDISSAKWSKYVAEADHGTFFHGYPVVKLYECMENIKPFALFALDGGQQIQGMLLGYIQIVKSGIWSLVSTRSVITQSPLYSEIGALVFLLKEYMNFIKGRAVYTELRAHIQDEPAASSYISCGFKHEGHLNYVVDCSIPDVTWKGISESKRRQIKKAIKNGVTINDRPSLEQVKAFYEILCNLYKDKVRKPIASLDYFVALFELGLAEGLVKFLLVMKDNKVIGGIVCPISSNWRIHEHYIAGLDYEYKECYPSVMATWAAIDFASKNGISEFDFMGAGNPNEDYGVREFKSKFGGDLQEPGRFILVHSQALYCIAKLGFKIYQKLVERP